MNQTKYISIILQDLNGGGAEKMMVNLCNYFISMDHRVDLVLVRKEGPWLGKVNDGVNIVSLNSRKVLFSLIPLVRYFRKQKPDVILSTLPHVNIITILAKHISRISSKLVIREANNIKLNKVHSQLWAIRFSYRLIPYLYRHADTIIAISEGLANQLRESIPKKTNDTFVIYNPVIDPSIDRCLKENSSKDIGPLNLKQNPIILSVGRLVPQKDFHTLIRAFKLVKQKLNASLVILGEGYLRGQLENLAIELDIREDVHLPGFTENPYKVMNLANVFVLSSRWEGFGNVLVEALYCGLPVVATDCPDGPAEVLRQHPYGRLVEAGDEVSMAREILACLNTGGSKRTIIDKRNLLDKYRVHSAGDQYLRLFFDK